MRLNSDPILGREIIGVYISRNITTVIFATAVRFCSWPISLSFSALRGIMVRKEPTFLLQLVDIMEVFGKVRRKYKKGAFLSAFGPLGNHEILTPGQAEHRERVAKKRRSKRRAHDLEEAREQKKFVAWARERGLEMAHLNNGASTKARRIHLHQMGCAAGAADILVFDRLPRLPDARGLAIEFKSTTGELSGPQTRWKHRVAAHGWAYHVARSADEARQICEWYGL